MSFDLECALLAERQIDPQGAYASRQVPDYQFQQREYSRQVAMQRAVAQQRAMQAAAQLNPVTQLQRQMQQQAEQYEAMIAQIQQEHENFVQSHQAQQQYEQPYPQGFHAQSAPVPVQVQKARQEQQVSPAEIDYIQAPAFGRDRMLVAPGADIE